MAQIKTQKAAVSKVMNDSFFKQGMLDYMLGDWSKEIADGESTNACWQYERGRQFAALGHRFYKGRSTPEAQQAFISAFKANIII